MSDYFRHNINLAKRFVSDMNIPISMLSDKWFPYFLELYEKDFSAMSKWEKLWKMIDESFGGDAEAFLHYYYEIRDSIIVTISNSAAYNGFNNMSMDRFCVVGKPSVSSNNVYNCDNVGKTFLGVDLRKANFQALRFVNPDIVLNASSYVEFIRKFTDLDYIAESKYTRQVVFGKLNPKRHITVEKWLVNEMWKVFRDLYPDLSGGLVSMMSDEFIVEVDRNTDSSLPREIETNISNALDIDVKVSLFSLSSGSIVSQETGDRKSPFYVRHDIVNGTDRLMCVPLQYHALVYKLYKGMPLDEPDYHFNYEGIECRFMENFKLLYEDGEDKGSSIC
ncbi:MAG: hypothetical protein J6Y37_15860 [Paludibacteraceae bacterium]|nr:hypothetical protein [Paludibacteraceae bacterium]